MAIHRVGPPTPGAEPTRRRLGRVLVTIDDLEALVTILRLQASDPDSVQVQFNGGYFTEAIDIRQLSDDEIVSLKISSDVVEVNLDRTQAIAVGHQNLPDKIDNMWARTRQTEIEPDRKDTLLTVAAFGLLTASFAFFLVSGLAGVGVGFTYGDLSGIVIGGAGTVVIPIIFVKVIQGIRRMPGAIIKAMTMAELRQLRSANQYPRLSWIWAVIATIVAAVAIVVAAITAK